MDNYIPLVQDIILDLTDSQLDVIYANQYDSSGRIINCHIQDQGVDFDCTNFTVKLWIKKSNGLGLSRTIGVDGFGSIDGNIVSFPIETEMTYYEGRQECYFNIYREGIDINSSTFYIKVRRTALQQDDIVDSDDYKTFHDEYLELKELVENTNSEVYTDATTTPTDQDDGEYWTRLLNDEGSAERYIKQGDEYQLLSYATSSESVEMSDGTDLQTNMDSIITELSNKFGVLEMPTGQNVDLLVADNYTVYHANDGHASINIPDDVSGSYDLIVSGSINANKYYQQLFNNDKIYFRSAKSSGIDIDVHYTYQYQLPNSHNGYSGDNLYIKCNNIEYGKLTGDGGCFVLIEEETNTIKVYNKYQGRTVISVNYVNGAYSGWGMRDGTVTYSSTSFDLGTPTHTYENVQGLYSDVIPFFLETQTEDILDYLNTGNKSAALNFQEIVLNWSSWMLLNDFATKEEVDKKIADLVNSAPETLDTLGELAQAMEENQDVVEALDSAITNKVDKEEGKGLFSGSYEDLINTPTLVAGENVTISNDEDTNEIVISSSAESVVDTISGYNPTATNSIDSNVIYLNNAGYTNQNKPLFDGKWTKGTNIIKTTNTIPCENGDVLTIQCASGVDVVNLYDANGGLIYIGASIKPVPTSKDVTIEYDTLGGVYVELNTTDTNVTILVNGNQYQQPSLDNPIEITGLGNSGTIVIETTNEDGTQSTVANIPVSALYDGDYIEIYADGSGQIYRENGYIASYSSEEITTEYISTTGELSEGATVIYKLAEAITESLTDEQVVEFKKLKTFKGVTHVIADGEVTMRYYVNNDSGETVSTLQGMVENHEHTNYASKTIYDDTTVNMGRAEGSTIGIGSFAFGEDVTASGKYSHAEGGYTTIGRGSNKQYFYPTASGESSHSEGGGTTASGKMSHSEGMGTTASGSYSHAEGYMTNASGEASHAEGYNTTASLKYAHAEGYMTNASGDYSHAEGTETIADGLYSHAEGYKTTTSGDCSHAEGSETTASGEGSHAEGIGTTSSGEGSHAEGEFTDAIGNYSHAEGYATTANGDYSHVEGQLTIASGDCQHVQGRFNIEDAENKYAHIVGGGTQDNDRKNIHTLDWDGNAEFAGDVVAHDTSGNMISLSDMQTAKQDSLGFTPIQQGGGQGQGTNKVYIGWAEDSTGLKVQVDETDLGALALRNDITWKLLGNVGYQAFQTLPDGWQELNVCACCNGYIFKILVCRGEISTTHKYLTGAYFGDNNSYGLHIEVTSSYIGLMNAMYNNTQMTDSYLYVLYR